MRRTPRIPLLLVLALAPVAVSSAPPAVQLTSRDDVASSKEVVKIAEEQALLHKQLKRLRRTMETLLDNLEAEGRPRASELLRDGLTLLDQRLAERDSLTLDEIMNQSRTRLERGQMVQALEDQEAVVEGLERLLAILMDRRSLDNLEESLEAVQALQRDLGQLADEERELRSDTESLREQSSSPAQRALESGIESALSEQREILRESEARGREAGTLELELLEDELRTLLERQETDAAVLGAWRPEEAAALDRAGEELRAARAAESRAARQTATSELLRETADALEESARGEPGADSARRLQELAAALDRESEHTARHARASGEESAAEAAEAMKRAAEDIRDAGRSPEEQRDAAARLEALAQGADARAAAEREAASAARQAAQEPLSALDDPSTAAGSVAEEVREALERAESSDSESSGARSREATEEAARALERGQAELEALGKMLSASQADQAGATTRLERGLATLPQGESEPGRNARESLERAAEAMTAAAGAARSREAGEAAEQAGEAASALEQALESVGQARQAAARETAQGASALAERQQDLAQEVGELGERAEEGSMSPEAEQAVEAALEEARAAMERAAEEMSEGASASAAGSQNEALSALQRAGEAAREGVRPSSPEEQERAEELARKQQELRERMLQLALRNQERENGAELEALDRAASRAQDASQSLSEGQLDQAKGEERDVERELEQAISELEDEEDQYQQLRQEELLFQIVQETQGLLDRHLEQMQATVEIDDAREIGELPSRGQRYRLRRIAREESAIGEHAGEMEEAIRAEGSLVFAALLRQVGEDLGRVGVEMDEIGDWQTGPQVQSLQEDVEDSLRYLLEALQEEQDRRAEEERKDDQEQQDSQQEDQNRQTLVPDVAELKLLRRMEVNIQDDIARMLLLYPELEEAADVDPLLLEDINRLAVRHERMSDLFAQFRERLGIPAPGETGTETEPAETGEEER